MNPLSCPYRQAGGTVLPAAHFNVSSHPVFRMPPAATSWASCLDDVVLMRLLKHCFIILVNI
jgi:hypothetical protein